MKVTLQVIRVATEVHCECPHCEFEIERKYGDFCDEIGEPCDWTYSKFECPECHKEIEIEYTDWD